MKKLLLLNGLFLLTFFLCFTTYAQHTYPNKKGAYINFNMGNSTLKYKKHQKATLFGCNTTVFIDSTYLNDSTDLSWGKANQVASGIPCGRMVDKRTKKEYYVSKYYIASPPVFIPGPDSLPEKNTLYDIGLVIPDEFDFVGDKPVQLVFMEYTILKPMYIEYFPVEFDTSFKNRIDTIIPFKVECKDFPWLDTLSISGAKGASGIGYLSYSPKHKESLFLPYYYENKQATDSLKTYLDCEVSILNDILLNYEVFFKIDGKIHTTINLRDLRNGKKKIQLTRKSRKDVPCGCKAP